MKNVEIVSVQMIKEGEIQIQNSKVEGPKEGFEILNQFIGKKDREHLVLLSLNTKNIINSISVVSVGSLNSAIVHPREVYKIAILSNAASIIIGHNHPSGDPSPSNEDINITNKLNESGKILGIELLDHIIIGDNTYVSFKDKGLL